MACNIDQEQVGLETTSRPQYRYLLLLRYNETAFDFCLDEAQKLREKVDDCLNYEMVKEDTRTEDGERDLMYNFNKVGKPSVAY